MENYQQNNSPKRQPILNIPGIIIAIVLLCVATYFIPELFFSQELYLLFYGYFAFIPAVFSHMPEQFFYTLISHSLLHGGVSHILMNMLWLIVFGSPLAMRLGFLRFVLFWCFSAALAALAYYIFHTQSTIPLVGASGAISGLMGGAARAGHLSITRAGRNRRIFYGPMLTMGQALKNRTVFSFIAMWFIFNFLVGFISFDFSNDGASIAWEAHIGGMLAGFLFFGLFDKKYNR